MLNINFGRLPGILEYPSTYFNNCYNPEWFDDPFVIEMVEDIGKVKVYGAHQIVSEVTGGFTCRELAGGIKNLILTYKLDIITNGTKMGDNCYPWLLKIANKKDVTICLMHYPYIPEPFTAKVLNSGNIIHTCREIADEGSGLI